MAIFGPRSKGFTYSPTRVDEGTSYMWSREIYGVKYSFTRVIMPDGELRWYMSKWIPSPYIDPAQFPAVGKWVRVREVVLYANGAVEGQRFNYN